MTTASRTAPEFGRRGISQYPTQRAAEPQRRRATTSVPVDAALLLAFVSRNRHKFEPTVEAMAAKSPDFNSMTIGWCWPAFFVPVLWLAYRKMYAIAALAFFAPIVLGYLAGNKSWLLLIVSVVFAMYAKSIYVSSAARRVRKILATESNPTVAVLAVREAGGGSVAAVWIVLVLSLLPGLAMVVAALSHLPR